MPNSIVGWDEKRTPTIGGWYENILVLMQKGAVLGFLRHLTLVCSVSREKAKGQIL